MNIFRLSISGVGVLLSAVLLFSCQTGEQDQTTNNANSRGTAGSGNLSLKENNENSTRSGQELPLENLKRRETSLADEVIASLPPSPTLEVSINKVKKIYEQAVPALSFINDFQLISNGDCNFTFKMGYEGEENVYKCEFMKLDMNKMNVFFDRNNYPGLQVFSPEGSNAIMLSSNGSSFKPVNEMILKLDNRDNVAQLTFAVRDMIKICQGL